MKYKKGYKYQLDEPETVQTLILPPRDIKTDWIILTVTGVIELAKGYAWDGATCVPDRKGNMKASAVHDALIQLRKLGHISNRWDDLIDKTYMQVQIDVGVWEWLALLDYYGLRAFGWSKGILKSDVIYEAP